MVANRANELVSEKIAIYFIIGGISSCLFLFEAVKNCFVYLCPITCGLTGSTSTQAVACCLTAPGHYLNQHWLLINEVPWHAPESNFAVRSQATILYNEFENHDLEITVTSPRCQWIKWVSPLKRANKLYRIVCGCWDGSKNINHCEITWFHVHQVTGPWQIWMKFKISNFKVILVIDD